MMEQSIRIALLLVTLCCLLPVTYQHRNRSKCPCARLPPAELSLRQVSEEAWAAKTYKIHCCPHLLLGFPADHYHNNTFNITWTLPQGTTFKPFFCQMETLETGAVKPADKGVYACTVTASNGTSVTRTIDLCVNINADKGKPLMSSGPRDAHALPGEKVTFSCSAYLGSSRCLNPHNDSMKWEKQLENEEWVPVNQLRRVYIKQYKNETEGKISSELVLESVEKAHYGEYRCLSTNQHGTLTLNATLFWGVPTIERQLRQYRAVLAVIVAGLILVLAFACVFQRMRIMFALYLRQKTVSTSPSASLPLYKTLEVDRCVPQQPVGKDISSMPLLHSLQTQTACLK